MAKDDEEKTAFITSQGIFCYSKMPFGLKNVGPTYQRLVDKAFHKQIGRNLEVYVDDLVIKSRTKDEIVRDIEETFWTLREINMKLNPKKCTFRVEEGMFLGYTVNTKGLKTLKKCTKKSDFHWTAEAEDAFKQMKITIADLPMLTTPIEREELIIYLVATKEAVSAVLMTEREAKQMPVYFVTHALRGPELNYTPMEKLVLALVNATKRPRVSLKGQVLADFIVERPEEDSTEESMEVEETLPEPWTLYTDGSSCEDGSGARLILISPEGTEFTYALRFRFKATNNESEYESLIVGLRIAEQMGIKNLQANVDSRLVANQVNGSFIAREESMIQYLEKVKTLTNSFRAFSIKQVPRSENKKADVLSKIASTSFAHLKKQVLVEELQQKSIEEKEVLAIVQEEGYTWMTPIYEYLTKETLPVDTKEARPVRRKSQSYAVNNGILYRKSFLGPWLRCVGPLQANYVLREIHEGSCSMHIQSFQGGYLCFYKVVPTKIATSLVNEKSFQGGSREPPSYNMGPPLVGNVDRWERILDKKTKNKPKRIKPDTRTKKREKPRQKRFNGIIEDRLAEEGVLGQKKVDFTGQDCLSYGSTLRRYNQCKIFLAPENKRLAKVLNCKVPTMNFSKSKSGSTWSSSRRSTSRRSTGGSERQFSSEDILSFDSQMRRMLVMEILNNFDGLDASYVLKVNSKCGKNEEYCRTLLNKRSMFEITNCDVTSLKVAVRMMIHRADDFTETIKEFKVNMLAFHEWIEMAAIGDTRTGNQWKRHSGGFPGDLSLGIPFPGDLSPGKRRWGRLVRDSFLGDNPRRKGWSHVLFSQELSATVANFVAGETSNLN
nr:reverse transcriptase domain-containing protein [Tanacetum cinerariifolium]